MSAQQTVIVTGGNAGLGYQCAKAIALANAGWHVIIASRDAARSAQAVDALRRESGSQTIGAMPLDLASLASIRAFGADYAHHNLPPLRALVCNAGVQSAGPMTYTTDGFETTFGVNHLGHFLLTNLLLQHLAPPARIVFVSSGTHDPATLDGRFTPPAYTSAQQLAWPERNGGRTLSGMQRYTTSKLCNILCAYELDRRLRAAGYGTTQPLMSVNAYDPGPVPGTGLIRDWNPLLAYLVKSPLMRLLGAQISDVVTSGRAMARLVLDPELAAVSGAYFQINQQRRSSAESYDRAKACELWESSAELVQLLPQESRVSSTTPVRRSIVVGAAQ